MGIDANACTTPIFTYGTLKRGFSNHALMQELIRSGDAHLVGTYRTAEPYPLVCGPFRVPFLLNMPGQGHRVMGELYEVSARGLSRLDELEGTSRGHYVRKPIRVVEEKSVNEGDEEEDGERRDSVASAEAYYAHGSFDQELWRRNGRRGFKIYAEEESKGYVRRKDRPQNLSFLDHIRVFVSSSCD